MESEHTAFQQALTAARARLWMLVRQDIDALRQLVDQSQQIMDDATGQKLRFSAGCQVRICAFRWRE